MFFQAFSTVGTPDYIAPEVLLKKGYGLECDWYVKKLTCLHVCCLFIFQNLISYSNNCNVVVYFIIVTGGLLVQSCMKCLLVIHRFIQMIH